MLYTFAIVLIIAWLLGVVGVDASVAVAHVWLMVAIVLFVVGFITGRETLA